MAFSIKNLINDAAIRNCDAAIKKRQEDNVDLFEEVATEGVA
jgi:hypothetical protein